MAELLHVFADLTQLVTLDALLALLTGLALGTLIGVLPGMGPLLGIYQGGSYGGAVTATILGIPGTPMAAATLLDAHPMARLGRASEAVTLATLASAVGGTLSALALILTAPALAAIAMRFGPAVVFALALLGLACIGTLSQVTPVKGLLAGLFGVVGYLMRKGAFPLAPFVIGVVLGPIFEANLRRTTIMVGGDFGGFLLGRPIALGGLALSIAALVLPIAQAWRARRSGRSRTRLADGLSS